jgi:hypothetical protein
MLPVAVEVMEVAVEWVLAARSLSILPASLSTMSILATALPQRGWEAVSLVRAEAAAVLAATVVPRKVAGVVMLAMVATTLVPEAVLVAMAEAISVVVVAQFLAPRVESVAFFLSTP